MKGVRRSVKRGQSVEFTDYRDYSLGDDLRSLDWNLYARLEKLFIKLFVEEEDVNVHVLLDASASMDGGTPDKLRLRQARRRGDGLRRARVVRPGEHGGAPGADRAALPAGARHRPRLPGAGRPVGRQARARADRPRRGCPPLRGPDHAARPAGADQRPVRPDTRSGRSASWPARAATWPSCTRSRPTSSIRRSRATSAWSTARPGDGVNVTADLCTLDEYRARLAAWQARLDEVCTQARAWPTLPIADDAAAGRPRVRRAAPAPGRRVTALSR